MVVWTSIQHPVSEGKNPVDCGGMHALVSFCESQYNLSQRGPCLVRLAPVGAVSFY
jgi:hypothetical protein